MPYELLCSLQFALYGACWALAAWLIPEERPALLHWAANGALQALAGFMAMQALAQGQLPPTICLAAALLGATVSVRGIDQFLHGRARDDRWGLALALPALAALGALDLGLAPGAERMRWQGLAYTLGMAGLLLFYAWRCWPELRRSQGRAAAIIVLAPQWVTGLAALASVWPRLTLDAEHMALMREGSRLPGAVASLITGGVFNLSYLVLLMGRLLGRLREHARTDHLTGVLNRRAIEAALQASWQRQRRKDTGLAVVLVDVDHFKQINDRFGHAAGDQVLAQVATSLQQQIRPYDHLGRWGGEEFLLVLHDQPGDSALRTCERLREAIAQSTLALPGGKVTASLGLAVAQRGEVSAQGLVQRADAAMYRAKAEGRDRTCLAEPAALAQAA